MVKRRLGVRWYVRYVDDLVLLAPQPELLVAWREAIRAMLRERLGLALRHDGDEPLLVARGIDFVGWRTWWSHRLARRRTLGNLTTRLDRFARRHWRPGPVRGAQALTLVGARAEGALVQLQRSLASSAGHLQHGSAWRAWAAAWTQYRWLGALFARDGWTFERRFVAEPLRSTGRFGDQYRRLVSRAGEATLI